MPSCQSIYRRVFLEKIPEYSLFSRVPNDKRHLTYPVRKININSFVDLISAVHGNTRFDDNSPAK